MSLTQQTLQRLPTIKAELIKGTSYPEIGKKLGVTERTIDRDISAFVDSGRFESWLKEEWLRLHNQVIHDDPTEAYRNVTKLIGRMVTQKHEVKEEIVETKNVNINVKSMLAEYQHLITGSRVEDKPVSTNGSAQQVHSPQANPEASGVPVT